MRNETEEIAQQIRALEQQRCDAMLAKDTAMLERLLDPELVYTHSSGVVDSKESYIAGLKDLLWDYKRIERSDEKIVIRHGAVLVFNRTQMNLDVSGVNKNLDNNTLGIWAKNEQGAWQFLALNSSPRMLESRDWLAPPRVALRAKRKTTILLKNRVRESS
jgi:hypothetical protein